MVTSDLHNVMARLRYVVGNLSVLSWQIDAFVKASATLGCRAHRSTLANGDVARVQPTPEGKSSATELLGRRRRSIVLSLGETGSTRRDKDRRATPNGILHTRDASVCAQRGSIGKKSLKHNGQQQNACDRSDATISFFRRQAETLRRTFRCRRRRRSLDVDTAVNETESKNAARDRGVPKPERRFVENVVSRRDCDKLSITAGKTVTHSIVLQRLRETTRQNDMFVCSGATNLVALSNVPKSNNISQTGDEMHRTYRRIVSGVPLAVKPLSRERFSHGDSNGCSPLSSRLSFSSQLPFISGSTASPAPSYNDVYEQALDETLDLVSDVQSVSPDPDTVESYTVHPAYHGITTKPGKRESSCYRKGKGKSMCVVTINGSRLPATKCRPSSSGDDYFWRSIIEP